MTQSSTNKTLALSPGYRSEPQHATRLKDRLWGPDIARGTALLGIALSNMYYFLWGDRNVTLLNKPLGGSASDELVNVLVTVLFDNRGFTLFSLLFGYGIGMLYARSQRRGETTGQWLLSMLKRHALLLGIGVCHAFFLFAGDIIVTYSLLGMLVCVLVIAPRWVRIAVAVLSIVPLLAMGAADGFGADLDMAEPMANIDVPDVSSSSLLAVLGWRFWALFDQLFLLSLLFGGAIVLPMLLGFALQRRDFFAKASQRVKPMIWLAAACIAVSVLGAIPAAWVITEEVRTGFIAALGIGALHQATGLIGAVGYAAVFALLGITRSALLYPLRALGSMSMSGYIAQSVVAGIVYPAIALGLGETLSVSGACLVAVSTWLGTLIVASVIYHFGKRGPVEWLFRTVLYRPWGTHGASEGLATREAPVTREVPATGDAAATPHMPARASTDKPDHR